MFLLFSLLFFNSPPLQTDPDSFKHFKKDGAAPYCMVDYVNKTIHCIYKNREDCTNHYDESRAEICFPRKSLKLGDKE